MLNLIKGTRNGLVEQVSGTSVSNECLEKEQDTISQLKIKLQESLSETHESKAKIDQLTDELKRKDKRLADYDGEVNSLKALIEGFKTEKQSQQLMMHEEQIRLLNDKLGDLLDSKQALGSEVNQDRPQSELIAEPERIVTTTNEQAVLLELPAQLTVNDIKLVEEKGTIFHSLLDFCKQTIVDACGASQKILGDADKRIELELKEKTSRKVTCITSD